MNEVLKITLSLSCSGALLIAILCLLRPLFRTRLSKQWHYYIWLAVIARLLFPFALEINLIGTLFQGIDNKIVPSEYFPDQDTFSALAPRNNDVKKIQDNFSKAQSGGEARVNALQNERTEAWIWEYLWLCWLVTALALLIRKITIYQSFVKYIRAGYREVADINLLEQFGRLVEQSKVKIPVELYTNSLISSPLLIGFFRPCIVLPTDKLSDTAFQYTILHELTHYKRRDMFYKWLIQITVCIHWFNPLVQWMSREVERACELSCDEVVIKELNIQERHAYGDTLLNTMENRGTYKNTLASVTLGESRERLKERLDAIISFRKKSKFVRLATAVLTIAVCFGSAAAGVYAAPLLDYKEILSAKPVTIGSLTLNKKEYTMEELKTMGSLKLYITTYSDDISVVRGGDTLKFEYYALTPEEYVFNNIKDYPWNLSVFRSPSDVGDGRSMTITIPQQIQFDTLQINTTSGNISLTDCTAETIMAYTQNGQIHIRGGYTSEYLNINTQTGDVVISETVLPDSQKNASCYSAFNTVSGTIIFQPPDSAEHYYLVVDYGEAAEIFINNEGISLIDMLNNDETESTAKQDEMVSGVRTEYIKKLAFTFNEGASKKICFHSLKGTLIVQEK